VNVMLGRRASVMRDTTIHPTDFTMHQCGKNGFIRYSTSMPECAYPPERHRKDDLPVISDDDGRWRVSRTLKLVFYSPSVPGAMLNLQAYRLEGSEARAIAPASRTVMHCSHSIFAFGGQRTT